MIFLPSVDLWKLVSSVLIKTSILFLMN